MIFMRRDLNGPPGKHPATLRKLDVHLKLSSPPPPPHWKNCGVKEEEGVGGECAKCSICANMGEGPFGQSKTAPLTGLMWSFSVSVVQGVASPSTLASEIFTVVSCHR